MKIIKLDGRYKLGRTYKYKMILTKMDSRILDVRKIFEQMYGQAVTETHVPDQILPVRKYNENWRYVLHKETRRRWYHEFYYNNESDATMVTLMS
jgi:hypothetical protein